MQSKNPQRSDWSPSNITISYNQQSLNTTKCNQTTDTLPTIRDRKRRIKSMVAKCVKNCSSIPPMYVGLLAGVLAGASLLTILIPLWLSSIDKTLSTSTTTTSSTTTSSTTTSSTTTSSTTTSSTTTSSTTTSSTTTSSTTTSSTTTSSTTTSSTTTGIPSLLTTTNENVYAIWNTTAAGDSTPSTVGISEGNYFAGEEPPNVFDQNVATKYTNFGVCGSSMLTAAVDCGINTGFYLTLVRGPSLLSGLRLCTGNNLPARDPLTITIEGSNQPSSTLTQGTSWTLIYTGSTGLDVDPGRYSYGVNINLSGNSVWYRSYRFLVTSKRGLDTATQYAEIETTGY